MKKQQPHINIELITRYLAGEATAREKEQVDIWLSSSAANKKEFDELNNTWESLGKTNARQKIDIDKEWTILQHKIRSTHIFSFRSLLRIAAAIILFCGISAAGYWSYTFKTVKTQHAEIHELALPDGSEVTLNANSKIRYKRKFVSKTREIYLKGEAFFNVEPDSSRPFTIHANQAVIQVLGTSFNVKAYHAESSVQVTVSEGKVRLYDKKLPQKHVIATKGDKAEFLKNEKTIKKITNKNQNFLAWKTRNIVFNNDNLAFVAKTIEEVYHHEIRLKYPNATACNVTARFNNEDFSTILQVLKNTLDIEIQESGDIIYLVNNTCQ